MPISYPNLTVDECPDALGFSSIRVADGTPNGDTGADLIATVYLDEFAPLIAAAPAMLAALQAILPHAEEEASALRDMQSDESEERFANVVWQKIEAARAVIAAATGSPTSEAEAPQTFTAFCQSSNGRGTVWIDTVEAPDAESAANVARELCAIEWGCEIPFVHCLGIAGGDVEILQWSDIDD